ncbi:MAG TPA: hypothetical protein VG222_13535 [Vicinamibacterales bacterium]|nr:hypothetical protein [Vicinamibacterales bacterium]
MRPIVRALASAWLLCQLTGLIAAPVAVCVGTVQTVASDEDECCPGVAPGQVCPMHHTREGGKHCVMRSDCASSTTALLTLVGGVGLLPSPVSSLVNVLAASGTAPRFTSAAIARSELPESPPPRA